MIFGILMNMLSNKLIPGLSYFLLSLVMMAGLIVLTDNIIRLSTKNQISSDPAKMPSKAVVLIPGSGNTTDPASPNYSFNYRMNKTKELYQSGKISKIVVSGISNVPNYNEPNDMKNALISMDIPTHLIYPDHGGSRTFISVKRIKLQKNLHTIIIISQRKQLERALFIANCLHLNAYGLEAQPVPYYESKKEIIHEMLSRVKCLLECSINLLMK